MAKTLFKATNIVVVFIRIYDLYHNLWNTNLSVMDNLFKKEITLNFLKGFLEWFF